MRLIQRLRRAIVSIPTIRDWLETALAAGALALVLAPAGLSNGLLTPVTRPAGEIAGLALSALFIPALGEELAFRATIPSRDENPRAFAWVALSTLVFIAWHALETLWLPGAAPIFLRPEFLGAAGLLGLACATLRRRSGSIWTAVFLHWIVVVAWQGWLGGPELAALR